MCRPAQLSSSRGIIVGGGVKGTRDARKLDAPEERNSRLKGARTVEAINLY